MQGWPLAVLAHSMGNQALTQALPAAAAAPGADAAAAADAPSASSSSSSRHRSFIFAAPDVSQTKFKQRLHDCSRNATYTLYCHKGDIALQLSKLLRLYKEPRAGDSSKPCLAGKEHPEFDTIDCSTTSQSPADPRRHSYVFKHPDVMKDILRVFQGKTPDERITTAPVTLQKQRVAPETVGLTAGEGIVEVLQILPWHTSEALQQQQRELDQEVQQQEQEAQQQEQEAQPGRQSSWLGWCRCLRP
jgi:esterase/lipase superfamily enzyme